MAALIFHRTQDTLLPACRIGLFRPLSAVTAVPAFLASTAPFNWSTPSLQPLFDFFPSLLLAVPKKKTSHSRKAMRSANKGLKDKQNIVNCPGCGSPKLAHHLCPNCYTFLSRMWKRRAKQASGPGSAREIPDLS